MQVTYSFGFVTDSTLLVVFIIFVVQLDLRFELVGIYLKTFMAFIAFSAEIFEWIFLRRFHLLGLTTKQFFKLVVALGYITTPQLDTVCNSCA